MNRGKATSEPYGPSHYGKSHIQSWETSIMELFLYVLIGSLIGTVLGYTLAEIAKRYYK